MADPDSSLSPEKKLLDIIEGSGPAGAAGVPGGEPMPPQTAPFDPQELLKPAFWLSASQGLIEHFKTSWKGQQSGFTLKRIIAACRLATVVLGVILGLNLVYELYETNLPLKQKSGVQARTVAEASEAMTPIYSSNIAMDQARRNVFAPIARTAEKADGKSEAALKVIEMTKQMKLTGISIHPEDPARTFCMIEDLQKNITAFLKVGDTISGMIVSRITPESVTLKYEEEEVDIR